MFLSSKGTTFLCARCHFEDCTLETMKCHHLAPGQMPIVMRCAVGSLMPVQRKRDLWCMASPTKKVSHTASCVVLSIAASEG